MYNAKIKKGKRILILFLIIITISFLNFNVFTWNSNYLITDEKSSTDPGFEPLNELKTADYSTDFSGTGKNVNITLHQSLLDTTTKQFSNLTVSNSFTEPCPTIPSFNSSFVNISIANIFAPDKPLDVEPEPEAAWPLAGWYYTSFEVPSSCNLTAVDVNVMSDAAGRIFYYDVFSAKFENSYIRPDQDLTGGAFRLGQVANDSISDVWLKLTGLNQFLNVSETYNNTFFIEMSVSGANARWNYEQENNAYETISYTILLEILNQE